MNGVVPLKLLRGGASSDDYDKPKLFVRRTTSPELSGRGGPKRFSVAA